MAVFTVGLHLHYITLYYIYLKSYITLYTFDYDWLRFVQYATLR